MIFRISGKLAPAFQSFMSSTYTCSEQDGYRICNGRLWRATRSSNGTCSISAVQFAYVILSASVDTIAMYNGYVLKPDDIVIIATPAGEIAYTYHEVLNRVRAVCGYD